MKNYNENTEAHSLAIIFKNGSLYPVVEDILEKEDYGCDSFGLIYQSIVNVVSSDLFPDVITVQSDLERRGILNSIVIPSNGKRGQEALEYLDSLEPNVNSLESYAYQIKELHGIRQLWALSENIKKKISAGKNVVSVLADIDIETGKISTYVGAQSKHSRSSRDVAENNIQEFSDAAEGKTGYISTLLNAWDDFVGGLYARLYLIAARANEGKSSLVLNLINNIAIIQNIKIKLFTFESSAEEINNKLVQLRTGIPTIRIEKGDLSPEELEKYKQALKEIAQAPISYDDSSEVTLPLLRTKIRQAVADGAKVIFIDQLEQIMIGGGGDSQPEYIKVNYISYRIKAYQREQNIPIVLVHQLNRGSESGENRNKTSADLLLSDLAQAGEKAPDAVLGIRTKTDPSFFWLKNRQGAKGKRPVFWNGSCLKFDDIDNSKKEQPELIKA